MVLPVLPTTPFLLLATFCFARSSTRLHDYLIHHKQFGPYLSNYHERAMTPRDKVRTLTLMWSGILVSAALIGSPITWIILPAIATLVMVHILRLKPRPAPGQTPPPESTVEETLTQLDRRPRAGDGRGRNA